MRLSLLSAVVMLIAAGCTSSSDVSVPDRVILASSELPDPASGDFLQASLRMQPQSPALALRLEREAGIDRQVWTFGVQQAMSGSTAHPGAGNRTEITLAENLNRITEQAHRVFWDGHVFYIIATAVDTPGGGGTGYQAESAAGRGGELRRYHHVHAVDEEGHGVASFRTGDVEPVRIARGHPRSLPAQPLRFDVVATDSGPWVVYRDREGVYARPLVVSDSNPPSGAQPGLHRQRNGEGISARLAGDRGHFFFGEPQLVSRAVLPVGEFQLVARVDDSGIMHVVWTDLADVGRNRHDVWYCRFDPEAGDACQRPSRLSRFANWDAVNLMVQGDTVYVSWVDNRFARGLWTRRNTAKLFLVKSSDRGSSFGRPVSVHPPHEPDEHAGFALTMPASGGGVLVFWSRQWRNNDMLDQDLHYGLLQPDLQTLLVGEDMVPGNQLQETLITRLGLHHRSLAGRSKAELEQ